MGFMDGAVGDPDDDDDTSESADGHDDTQDESNDNPLTDAPDKTEMGGDTDANNSNESNDDDTENADADDSSDESNDVGDAGDDESAFESQIRTLITAGRIPGIDKDVVEDRVESVEDTRLLKMAFENETRDDVRRLYAERYEAIKEGADSLMAEWDDEYDCTCGPNEACDECGGQKTSSSDDADSPVSESGNTETDSDDTPAVSDAGTEPTPDASTGSETVTDGGGSGAPENVGEIDISDIAPGAVSVDEAAQKDSRWTIEVWAEPGKGKSHFAYTMPQPIVFLDTEGKADELAEKFDGQIHIFEPTNYDEAKAALEQGLEVLDKYRHEQDRTGTLVVDSMSVMWEWAQQKYVDVYYPNQSVDEVEFSAGIGGGQSDWKQIKAYHNAQFRALMVDSPYHLCWTAMEKDDYEAAINDGARNAKKPDGEKNNVYKVDEVLRIKDNDKGRPTAQLQKSGKIKHRYDGLEYPTFDKHRDVVETIKKAEKGKMPIQAVPSNTHDVEVVEGNPKYLNRQDDDD